MFKTNYTRFLLGIFMTLLSCFPSKAVLTGANMEQTLSMLNSELTAFAESVDSLNALFASGRKRYLGKLRSLKDEAEQVALMFYSQQDIHIFGQAYSAEKASEVVAEFDKMRKPSEVWVAQYDQNIVRCEKLLKTLQGLDQQSLSSSSKSNIRKSSATLEQILRLLREKREQITVDHEEFHKVGTRMDMLKKDITESYEGIHHRVFFASDRSYTEVLANFGEEWNRCKTSIGYIFHPSSYAWHYEQQWARDGNIVLWTILITFLLSFVIFYSIHKWGSRHGFRPRVFLMPRIFGYTCACILTTLALFILHWWVIDNSFYQGVISICIKIAMLCIVVFLSVSVRLPKRLMYPTIGNYLPSLFLTVTTLFMRMMLADSMTIRVVLVPVIIVGVVMQVIYNYCNRRLISRFDRICNEISCIIYIVALVMAWMGRYFFSLQIIIIWTILLTGIIFVSFAFHAIARYGMARKCMNPSYRGSYFDLTLRQFVKPALLIAALLVCLYECAQIFNITEWLESVLTSPFIDFPGKIRISLLRIGLVAVMALATRYIMSVIRNSHKNRRLQTSSRFISVGMAMQMATTLVWGAFAVVSLFIFEVNGVGILAILSGVMVGVGIALRDTIDCFLCGIAMMMGRVKVGDYVMCENVRGRVIDIQYRTTQIETEDGAIVSFFNTSFFGKNYRNLTRNGKYERMLLNFKLQKDADITSLREEFINELLEGIPEIARHPAPRIHFVSSERFYMDLMAEVWVPVDDYLCISSRVKELLFLSIRKHGLANMMPDVRTRIIEESTPKK